MPPTTPPAPVPATALQPWLSTAGRLLLGAVWLLIAAVILLSPFWLALLWLQWWHRLWMRLSMVAL